jgi:hypothetical protein
MDGEDKYQWYDRTKYKDSDEDMAMYAAAIAAYSTTMDITIAGCRDGEQADAGCTLP